MRDLINTVESLSDDSATAGAALDDSSIYIGIGEFRTEHETLAQEFQITDEATIKAVRQYTYASTINDAIATHDLHGRVKHQYDLLMGLSGYAIDETHHVYSGTGTFDPRGLTQAGIFTTDRFLSTSLNIEVAAKTTTYRREQARRGEDHILHLIIEAGFDEGFYIAPYSNSPEELEYLVMPDARFEYLTSRSIDTPHGLRHIHSFRSLRRSLNESADPSYLCPKRPPKYLYHGTWGHLVPRILKTGLDPYESKSSLDAVFLTDDPSVANGYAFHNYDDFEAEAPQNQEWVVLRIDFSALNPAMLGPDNYELEDKLADMARDEEDDPCTGMRWHQVSWQDSLRLCNQVTYTGGISPSAISIVEKVDNEM